MLRKAFTLRSASAVDIGVTLPLLHEAAQWDADADPSIFVVPNEPGVLVDYLQERLSQPGARLWLAEADNMAVGYLLGRIYDVPGSVLIRPHRKALIESLGVTLDWRGNGIGGDLMGLFETHARQQGATILSLHVVESNRDAQVFYTRLGFRTQSLTMSRSLV